MKVICWDCGKPLSAKETFERPRSVKSGWNNTVDVCEVCLNKWLDKHPEFKT